MDHATATHVVVIVSFSYKLRKPAMVICNAGHKNTLESNPVWEGLKRSGIQVKGVSLRHKFLNFADKCLPRVEDTYDGNETRCQSIYSQDDTLIELTHKLNLDSHILNFVPIQVKHSDLYQTSFEAGDPQAIPV